MVLPLWAGAFAAGVLAGVGLPGPAAAWAVALAAAVGGGALLARRHRALGSAGVLLAAGLWAGRDASARDALAPGLAQVVRRAQPVVIEGRWLRTLRADADPGMAAARGLLELERVAGLPGRARVALAVGRAPGPLRLAPGDRIRFAARLDEPAGLANPGRPEADLPVRIQGVQLHAFVRDASDIAVLARGWRLHPRRLAFQAHLAMAAAIDRAVPGPRARLLRALVLGERSAAGPEVEAGFKAAGAVHALSVSGLHLTALAGLAFLVLRRGLLLAPGLALRVRPDVVAAALALPLIAFYTLLTGEAVATVRAAVMATLALVAVIVRRLPSVETAIAAAALLLLGSSPLLVLDASFQLSFASVIALAVLARRWSPGAPGDRPLARAGRWLGRGLAATAAAFAVTGPLCAHHFAELAPASPLGNLLLVPVVEIGIVPVGLLGAAVGAVSPVLGLVPLRLAGLLCTGVLWLADLFRRFAPLWRVWSPDGFEAGALALAALLALLALSHLERRRWLVRTALLAALAGAGSLATRALVQRLDPSLRVTFLDIGQGDAALIEGPRGFVALIDGGGNVDGRFDPGARVIDPVLRRKTIGRLDLVVLSHPHPDHMNGLTAILERFEVKALWTAGDGGGNPAYDRLLALARTRGVELPRPAPFTRGPLIIQPRGPFTDDAIAAAPGLSVNDASLVVRVGFAGRWLLFPGDIEEQGEAELVARATAADPLASDVLKVPHHGSRTSSSEAFVDAVRPQIAVASLGRRNRFGFPRAEVVERYRERSVRLFRTDIQGAVVLKIDTKGGLEATCTRPDR